MAGIDIVKREDHDLLSIPTADEVMDSTEQDHNSMQEESDQRANINHEDFDGADDNLNGSDEGGLFGSGSEDENDALSTTEGRDRKLDDEELDSDDAEERNDRMDVEMDGAEEVETRQEVSIGDVKMSRHGYPRPSDDSTYLMKLPNHMSIDPKRFSVHNFQPPSTDHHSHGPPSSTFTPAQTNKTTIRWRRSPNDPMKLQSNTRVIRWSDGSFTLQLASNPMEQYELQSKPLAPPKSSAYEARLDSHTYLASVHQETSFAQITNHVSNSLTVQATTDQNDDAVVRLQESMAAAVKGNKNAPDGGVPIISISEDPEQAKKRAELAEREKIRAQRRRKNQEERDRDRANRVLGRSGLRTGMGGLTVGGLEDDEGIATSKPRAKPARKPKRRNSEYSDDESDFRNRGRTREDEYDEDDGFLVRSDEEPEVAADDSEEEEEMGERRVRKEGRAKRTESKDDQGDGGASRVKRRTVVDEEDEEE